jgi:hypothetical protein
LLEAEKNRGIGGYSHRYKFSENRTGLLKANSENRRKQKSGE